MNKVNIIGILAILLTSYTITQQTTTVINPRYNTIVQKFIVSINNETTRASFQKHINTVFITFASQLNTKLSPEERIIVIDLLTQCKNLLDFLVQEAAHIDFQNPSKEFKMKLEVHLGTIATLAFPFLLTTTHTKSAPKIPSQNRDLTAFDRLHDLLIKTADVFTI